MSPTNSAADLQLSQWQRKALIAGLAGTLIAIAGVFLNRDQFLRSYLYGYLYWTGMALGCTGILMLHHVVGGKWGMVIRRMCEAGARTLPYMFILLIPVLASIPILYVWARPEAAQDAVIRSKTGYLNVPFFLARAVFYFLVWTFYAWELSRWSSEQDRTGDRRLAGKMRALSAPGIVVFVFTTTFAFVDWIMSLEPDWFSTIYGLMFLIGNVLQAFALIIALLIGLSKLPPLRDYVTPQHFHDLGNMMFTFTVLWAYLSVSQFIIIWSGNLPEETPWYLRRVQGGWGWIAVILVLFHFAVPFLLLLQRDIKRRANLLLTVCAWMIVIRLIDVYWIVEPAFYNRHLEVHWLDFVTPLAVGGLWMAAFLRELKSRPLLPVRDPRLEGVPRETVAF